jgi:uncharacterized membrane protein YccF (DUF307 family)
MKTLGNIIWIIFGGLLSSIAWLILGLLLCITIVGIPFGKQCFKMAQLYLAPFGTEVQTHFEKHPVMNIIWIVLCGWEMAVANLVTGIIFCITIVGIPFGKQWFKLTSLSLIPFGATLR